MKTSWQSVKLGDICRFQAGNAFPRHAQGAKDGAIPFIKVSDMNLPLNTIRIVDANNWIDKKSAASLRVKTVPPGSVVFAKIGEALKAERLRTMVMPTAIDNNLMAAIPIEELVETRFLYYLLDTVHLAAWAEGSALPYLRQQDLAAIRVTIPSMEEQLAISATLGALDDKIESNRRAIDLAEALADQLFARKAKGSAVLTDIAKITMGSSPPGDTYNEDDEGMPFYQGVRDFGRRFPGYRVWTTGAVRLAQNNDTLVSVRAPVGELNRSREICCIGRGVAAVSSDWPSTIFYALRSADSIWEPFQHEGTVFGAINKVDLSNAQLPWPEADSLRELESNLSLLDEKIWSLSKEIENLIALREALLPELLSGRVRVSEAVA